MGLNYTVTQAQLNRLNHKLCYTTKCYSLITENTFLITLTCNVYWRRDVIKGNHIS